LGLGFPHLDFFGTSPPFAFAFSSNWRYTLRRSLFRVRLAFCNLNRSKSVRLALVLRAATRWAHRDFSHFSSIPASSQAFLTIRDGACQGYFMESVVRWSRFKDISCRGTPVFGPSTKTLFWSMMLRIPTNFPSKSPSAIYATRPVSTNFRNAILTLTREFGNPKKTQHFVFANNVYGHKHDLLFSDTTTQLDPAEPIALEYLSVLHNTYKCRSKSRITKQEYTGLTLEACGQYIIQQSYLQKMADHTKHECTEDLGQQHVDIGGITKI